MLIIRTTTCSLMKLNVVNGGSQWLVSSGSREPERAMQGASAGVSCGLAQSGHGHCIVTELT